MMKRDAVAADRWATDGPEYRAARLSAASFAWLAGALILAGVGAILTGQPFVPRGAVPVADLGDLLRRIPELSLPLSAATAAVVAVVIGVLLASRRLSARLAAVELAVLALATEAAMLAGASHFAYASDGAIMPGAVTAMTGGAAMLISAIAASLVSATVGNRDVGSPRRTWR